MENVTAQNLLGDAIRATRGTLTQLQFAALIVTGIDTLRAWEKGTKAPRYYRHVAALIDAGVDEELFRPFTAAGTAA